jgi:cytochrome P450
MSTTEPAKIDFLSETFFANPYPTYAWLREHEPVFWSEQLQAWFVTRHEDVIAILRDSKRFSNAGRQLEMLEHLPPSAQAGLCPMKEEFRNAGIFNADPPEHTRLRQLLSKAFAPQNIERLRPRIVALTNELLDAHLPNGQMDIVRDLATPMPLHVFCEMMGVPLADRDRFVPWSQAVTRFLVTPQLTVEIALQGQEAVLQFKEYFRGLLAERKKNPQQDILTALAEAEEMGDRFTEQEILSTARNLMLAGQNTTSYLIGNAVYLLLTHPDQMQKLLANPALVPAAVEETLRHSGTVHGLKRLATQDVTLRGKTIRKGQAVVLSFGSANHDISVFERADEFDITRPIGSRHIAFGYGIHFCIGMPLAMMEVPIVLEIVLSRLRNLQLADASKTRWVPNIIERGLTALPVTFTASRS